MRARNRLKVVQALHSHPGSSRAALAEHTGLSRPTLSTLLDELEARGLVQRLAREADGPRGSGRPPDRLALAARAGFAVGVDIGHTHVRVAVCDLSGDLVADDWSAATVDHAPGASLDLARDLVSDVLARAQADPERVVGVGVGIAAPVDTASGVVHADGILPSWGGLRPAQELEDRLGLPVRLDNDANVGALGEQRFGAGRGVQDLLYLRLSDGIGVGLVLGGRLYRGGTGIAGEFGHVQAVPGGALCRCGKHGCLETVATPAALAAAAGHEPAAFLRRAAERTDAAVDAAVAQAGATVGRLLASVVSVLNPTLVLVGGDLARTGEALLGPLREAVAHDTLAPVADAVRIAPGGLGDRAEVLGAAGLVLAAAPGVLAGR